MALHSRVLPAVLYRTFVTGLTIGYGDTVPRQAHAHVLAIGIGVSGLFLTGLISGIAVYSMRTALTDGDAGCAEAVKPPARNQLEFISTNGYGS
jgi:hypothetical protein